MDRRETARLFRHRLAEAMQRSNVNRSDLARRVGIDRSTLSQLLASETDRLPRADTVAAIAAVLQVSLDWLLGLSREEKLGADILHESLEVAPRTPADEGLARWHRQAAGYKIRYVPATLPDMVKTEAVTRHEFGSFAVKTTDQAITASEENLAHMRRPETDVEVCTSTQNLTGFAGGEGVWAGLPAGDRLDQLDRMAALAEELYPSLRMYLFDGLTHFSVPYTVFGPQRAAIYVGQMYFVFNTTEHIRVLSRHFDDLIRAAVVQAPDAPAYLRRLRDELAAA